MHHTSQSLNGTGLFLGIPDPTLASCRLTQSPYNKYTKDRINWLCGRGILGRESDRVKVDFDRRGGRIWAKMPVLEVPHVLDVAVHLVNLVDWMVKGGHSKTFFIVKALLYFNLKSYGWCGLECANGYVVHYRDSPHPSPQVWKFGNWGRGLSIRCYKTS